MKGNTKKVLDSAKRHILSFYAGEGGKKALLADGNAVGGATDYHKGKNLCEGGSFYVYDREVRPALQKIMHQSKKESEKYSDQKVWQQYMHMCGRAYEAIAREKPKMRKKRRKSSTGRKSRPSGGCVGFFV